MSLSVVVCTLNRCSLLSEAIDSLMSQKAAPVPYEVLVIDNGSTDETRRVVENRAACCANLRYVHEPCLGLSHARNRGVREARGDVIAFMDDDASASACWAAELWAAYDSDADVGAVGGRVKLRWPTRRPEWLPQSLEGYYGALDLGDLRQHITYPVYPYGLNMSIKRALLVACGGFSTRLGRTGRNLISLDETELFYRLNQQGIKVVYQPGALVYHRVEVERVTRRWLLRRSLADGRSKAIFEDLQEGREARVRPALGAMKRTALYARRALVSLVRGKARTPELMKDAGAAAYFAGYGLEIFRSLLEARRAVATPH